MFPSINQCLFAIGSVSGAIPVKVCLFTDWSQSLRAVSSISALCRLVRLKHLIRTASYPVMSE